MKTNRLILPVLLLGLIAAFSSCSKDEGVLGEEMGKRNSDVPQDVFYHCRISNADELFSFAERVNNGEVTLNARLMNDIDISRREWTPIARIVDKISFNTNEKSVFAYNGVFNGNGHKIVGLRLTGENNDDAAFVGLLGPTGIIENLTLAYMDINAGKGVAGLCAYSQGELFACTALSGDVTGESDVAAICAYNYGLIKKCYNQASVHGKEYAAGICANNKMGIITECDNSGEVVGVNNASVGGVACVNQNLIVNCKNYGKVRSGFPEDGIAGICAQNYSLVYNCINDGEVDGGLSSVGGICGRLIGENHAEILNCVNTGPVIPVKKNYVGAICGWSTGDCVVTDCYYGPERSQLTDGLGGQPANYATMCTTIRNYLNKNVDEIGELRVRVLFGTKNVSMKTWNTLDKSLNF